MDKLCHIIKLKFSKLKFSKLTYFKKSNINNINLDIWTIIINFLQDKLIMRLVNKSFAFDIIYKIIAIDNIYDLSKNANFDIVGQKIGFGNNIYSFCLPNIKYLECGNDAINNNFGDINPCTLKLVNADKIYSEDISHMTNLIHLVLYNSKIKDNALANINNLVSLICDNKAFITNHTLSHNVNIQNLKCSNLMTNKGIMLLNDLNILICNKIITGKIFEKHKNITVLSFMHNFFINDYDICKLTTLRILQTGPSISNNGIYKLNKLQKLNCEFSNFIDDDGVKNLVNINELVCNNNLTDFSLFNLTNLVSLYLGNNTIISNNALYNKYNLKYLYCGNNNNITNSGLKNLNKLELLECMNNSNISYCCIKKLKNLHCLMCNLKKISCTQILNLKNINRLSLAHNITDNDVFTLKTKIVNVYNSLLSINSVRYIILGILERKQIYINNINLSFFYKKNNNDTIDIYIKNKCDILKQFKIKLYNYDNVAKYVWDCYISFYGDNVLLNKCKILMNDII